MNHLFGPYYNKDSEILILGSFPSVKSREVMFYYGHPQNRFFKVISGCFNEICPVTLEERKTLLKKHKIALWDVVESCNIKNSADSTIKDVVYCDIEWIIRECPIKKILVNGKTAYHLFNKHFDLDIPVYCLPSTSPANAVYRLDDLIKEYKEKINA